MNMQTIGLMVYQGNNPDRNALTEDNYKGLADALSEAGFCVESVLYHDSKAEQLTAELERFAAVLVWVNPIMEQGMDRRRLDKLLIDISNKGVFVSTRPEVILKLGTKEVLYSTRNMDWGGDIEMYFDYADFESRFVSSLNGSNNRILKQYRGDGGKGVFKVRLDNAKHQSIRILHAVSGSEEHIFSKDEFHKEFKNYFENGGLLVNQKWVHGITNGMVRCYLTGTRVSGFGYQETVALCPLTDEPDSKIKPASKRFYFSEDCGLFQDLRKIVEQKWIPQLQEIHAVPDDLMPLLWDIDLFINDVNTSKTEEKYTLCEINVSCVSPFPPSCIEHIVNELKIKFN